MLNLHFVREWHTFFWAQSQLKMKIRRFFRCFCLKIAQNLNFTQVFPRFFPQALLCGFSKLQLQTQATAQVGKSHSGRSGARRFFLQKVSFCCYLQRLATPTRRITARQRSTVTCASKTPSKIDKNMLNLHFVREWHTFSGPRISSR